MQMFSRWRGVVLLGAVVGLGTDYTKAETVFVGDVKTLTNALKGVKPGDEIVMKTGVWMDAQIKIPASVIGTADKPIVIRAEASGKTVLSGASSLAIGGKYVVVDGLVFKDFVDKDQLVSFHTKSTEAASDCTLKNVSISDPIKNEDDGTRESHWMNLYGQRNTVTQCYLQGKRTASPMFTIWVEDKPNDHHIHHNLFGGREPLGKNGGETIRVGTSQVSMNTSRTIVEDNYFEHCNGEAEIISNKSCENVYRRNVFFESKGCLVMRHGNRCVVEGNWFFGNGVKGTGGIRLIGEDHRIINNYLSDLMGTGFESAMPICDGIPNSAPNGYFQVKRALIANNTVVNCAQTMIFGVGHGERNRSQPALDVVLANNLFASTHTPIITVLNAPVNATWTNNIIWPAPAETTEGLKGTDPKLEKQKSGLYQLASGSPGIGGGKAIQGISMDIQGRARGTSVDVGAMQNGAGPAVTNPITKGEVGPEWMRK